MRSKLKNKNRLPQQLGCCSTCRTVLEYDKYYITLGIQSESNMLSASRYVDGCFRPCRPVEFVCFYDAMATCCWSSLLQYKAFYTRWRCCIMLEACLVRHTKRAATVVEILWECWNVKNESSGNMAT